VYESCSERPEPGIEPWYEEDSLAGEVGETILLPRLSSTGNGELERLPSKENSGVLGMFKPSSEADLKSLFRR